MIAIAGAIEFAPLVGATVPVDFPALATALDIDTAPVPGGESGARYHPEYDGYPNGPKGKRVKQADTVMLPFPLGVAMDAETQANDLAWYEPNTDPGGPAMTWAVFAIGWLDVGNYTRASELFRRGFELNVKPPFMVWQETPHGGCTPFLTGAGGLLQSVVFGSSGMRLLADRLTFNPPPASASGGSATSITMHGFHYRGSQLSLTVTEDHVSFVLDAIAPGAPPLEFVGADGKARPLVLGEAALRVPRAPKLEIRVRTKVLTSYGNGGRHQAI
jgi:hypothetical protein